MKNAIAKRFFYLLLAAAIAVGFTPGLALADYNIGPQNSADVKPGTWGGRGISLVVEKNSATIELDCAKVAISSRLRTGKGGRFAATGHLMRSGPGPIRLDSPPKPQPVRFAGRILRKQMTLKITLADSGEVVGTFALERDKQGELVRCF